MRVLYLGLFVLTFLSVLWAILLFALPIGPVDRFYAAHKIELHDALGDERAVELMDSISATIAESVQEIVLAVGVPLLITTFGWFAMFIRYAQPRKDE